MAVLDDVKLALSVSTTTFDTELTSMINAAVVDLGIAGVINLMDETVTPSVYKPIVDRAIKTYCKMHFLPLEPKEYDRIKDSYDEQKAQLVTATGYTDWDEDDD